MRLCRIYCLTSSLSVECAQRDESVRETMLEETNHFPVWILHVCTCMTSLRWRLEESFSQLHAKNIKTIWHSQFCTVTLKYETTWNEPYILQYSTTKPAKSFKSVKFCEGIISVTLKITLAYNAADKEILTFSYSAHRNLPVWSHVQATFLNTKDLISTYQFVNGFPIKYFLQSGDQVQVELLKIYKSHYF